MASIYISSLPFKSDEAFIAKIFSPHGKVNAVELHADWVNPTYEPYAYVELETADVDAVVEVLDGQKFGQNHIRVHKRVFL